MTEVAAGPELATGTEPRRARRAPPSLPALVFLLWAVLVPLAFHGKLINSDGDLPRHLRHGEVMLATRSLITADPFSYTRAGEPFLAFEYGSQLFYAAAHRVGGLPAVVALAAAIIAATYGLLTSLLLRRGVDPFLAYLTSVAAAVLGAMHWSARPHLISTLAIVALLALLEAPRQRLWAVGVLFAVWANLHGGFVLGWILIGTYAAGSLSEWTLTRAPAWRAEARANAAALAVAIAAPMANPHGLELYRHVVGFFAQSGLLATTSEFFSPDFDELNGRIFLGALLVTVTALTLVPRRPTMPRLLVILAMTAFSLMAQRNIPLFGAVALPLLALHATRDWERLPDPRGIRAVFRRDAARGRTVVWLVPGAALLVALAVTRGTIAGLTIVPDRFASSEFPIAAVDRARAAGIGGHGFHDFLWGGYLLYAWPEQRVFIDGGTDFYGEALVHEYLSITGLRPGWRDALAARDVDWILVRAGAPLAAEVSREPGWSVWHCDSTAVLLLREPQAASAEGRETGAGTSGVRCGTE